LWEVRDTIARERDVAPGRVLPDSAIVDAAVAAPIDEAGLVKLPVYRGRAQRRLAGTWARALKTAAELPRNELPDPSPQQDGPPPPNRWADKDPAAAARLSAARASLTALAESLRLPVENMVQPDLIRRICWTPPADIDVDGTAAALRAGSAREWQVGLVAELLSKALHTKPAEPADP
jgi:ribonuclease D